MTKKVRTILFIVIVALFLSITPLIIFYSQGYRFDFETKKIFQTGAFSFKAWPSGAQVFIDNKLVKKTNFLFGTVYIENLLPKKYTVRIKKEGYLPWTKTLEIKERWATENKNILLVPESPQFDFLEKEVDGFFLSPDGKMAILKKNGEKGWILTLFALGKSTSSPLFEEEDFLKTGKTIDFVKLEWSSDSRKLLLETKAEENKYFIIEIGETPTLYSLDFLRIALTNISFFPDNSQRILFAQSLMGKNSIFSADYKSKKISGPLLNNLLTFKVLDNSLIWLDNKGFLRQSDLSGNKIRQFNTEAISLNPDSQYQLFPFATDKIFLKENSNFYFFEQENQSLEKISENLKGVKPSSSLKKLTYFTDYEIWILFLEKIEEQPRKEKGEKLFLARFSEKIKNVFWWTSHYLIFSIGDKIKITEIDDRDRINAYDLAEFENPEIFWNKYDKKLYILNQGNLFSSKKLLP